MADRTKSALAENTDLADDIQFVNDGAALTLLDIVQRQGGDVIITNSGAIVQGVGTKVSGAGLLRTVSVGGLDLREANEVLSFAAHNSGGEAIYFNNALSLLTVLNVVQGDGPFGGRPDIEIGNTGGLRLDGEVFTSPEASIHLRALTGTIVQDEQSVINAGHIATTSAGGQTLMGHNEVDIWQATNEGGGAVVFHSDTARLSLGDLWQKDGGDVIVRNTGHLFLDEGDIRTTGAVSLESVGGEIVGHRQIIGAVRLSTRSAGRQTLQTYEVSDFSAVVTGEGADEPLRISLTGTGYRDLRLLDIVNDSGGDIEISSGLGMLLAGTVKTDGSVALTAHGTAIFQTEESSVSASSFTTKSLGGQLLLGANTVGTWEADNSVGGDIRFNNMYDGLTLGNVRQRAGGVIEITNVGDAIIRGVVQAADDVNLHIAGALDVEGVVRDAGNIWVQVYEDVTISGEMTKLGVVVLMAGGAVTQEDDGRLTDVAGLTVHTGRGQSLTGDNTVAVFASVNMGAEEVRINNTYDGFRLTALRQYAGGDIVVTNVGDTTINVDLTTTGGVDLTTVGELTLDDPATIEAGAVKITATEALDVKGVIRDAATLNVETGGHVTISGEIIRIGQATMTAGGAVAQTGAGRFSDVGTLTVGSVGGLTLTGDNTVAVLNALNDGGDIRMNNTHSGLTLGNVRQAGEGHIVITNVGDIRVQTVAAVGGAIDLYADGSIVNGNAGTPDIDRSSLVGADLVLTATGSIGAPSEFLYIDSSNGRDGVVAARANDGIYISETDGDLRVNEITAAHGDVYMTAHGSIINRGVAEAVVWGAVIDVRAIHGDIGEQGRRLTVLGEAFNAVSAGDMFIGVPTGDLVSHHLESEHGRLDLFVPDGALRLGTVLTSSGVNLSMDRVDILHFEHTGSSPLHFNVSGRNGFAEYVNIVGSSLAGIVFEFLGAEEAYVDLATDHLSLQHALIGRRGEFRSNVGFVIAENVVMDMLDADLQIFPRDNPFYLVLRPGRHIETDAFIVHHNYDYIINGVRTDNRALQEAEKLSSIVSDIHGMTQTLGLTVPAQWWSDAVDEPEPVGSGAGNDVPEAGTGTPGINPEVDTLDVEADERDGDSHGQEGDADEQDRDDDEQDSDADEPEDTDETDGDETVERADARADAAPRG